MQNVALLTDADKDEDNNDKVSLMTIHAAKGLEFPYVFIVGLEENLFPSIHSINSRADLEEERRLFYVALTRAMNKVILSYAESRYQWGQFTISEPSRFLEEIDESLFEKPKKASIKLDLHGMRGEEAIEKLDKFISDALLSGFDEIIVYHGIGLGILSKLVKEFLLNTLQLKIL